MQTEISSAIRIRRTPLPVLVGFWVCVLISLAVVARRLVALTGPFGTTNATQAQLDAAFSSHAVLTVAHIIPAAIFVILSVVILFKLSKAGWLYGAFFVFGAITGITAYLMSAYAIGGWIERSAVLVFDTWFLVSLGRAFWFFRQRDRAGQRGWTVRAVGILLGIATTRPVMGVFFATSTLTHLSPTQFFGIAFWIGFSINAIATELWLHSRRRQQLAREAG